jgi:hypothetical protein
LVAVVVVLLVTLVVAQVQVAVVVLVEFHTDGLHHQTMQSLALVVLAFLALMVTQEAQVPMQELLQEVVLKAVQIVLLIHLVLLWVHLLIS